MLELIQEIVFIFERLSWTSVVDIVLVTLIFFVLLVVLRDTQSMSLVRGMILLVIGLLILTQVLNLPAFSWLIISAMPTLLLAIPVVFSQEIRRGLERIGRTSGRAWLAKTSAKQGEEDIYSEEVTALMIAIRRLSDRKHGALIVLQCDDLLNEYIKTGVLLNARLSAEILLQIFYPNTPLHDGAVIIDRDRVVAGSCVLPLSSSGLLNESPERQMGLRHRASMGISESSDALVIVVSEETGAISIVKQGHLEHHVSSERLEEELRGYYHPELNRQPFWKAIKSLFSMEDAAETTTEKGKK